MQRFLNGTASDPEMLQCEAFLSGESSGDFDPDLDLDLKDGLDADELIDALRHDAVQPELAESQQLRERLQALASRHAVGQEELQRVLGPPESDDELGRIDGFRVLEYMASGGMGLVFKAEDPQLERLVCIKVMHPLLAHHGEARDRFQREARAAARLRNERIVTILHVGVFRDLPYIVMQLLEGESLHARLLREGALPAEEAVRVAVQIAEGLRYAHAQDVLHRDIKPDNIWITTEGDVKLLDFGLARAVDESARLTNTGTVMGTPRYMSPEQVQSRGVDQRSDLFSLGAVLYEMLAGVAPFARDNVFSTMMAVANDTPDALIESPQLQAPLRRLLQALLQKDPALRPASANIVINALKSITPTDPTTQTTPERGNKRPGWLAALWGAAAMALLLAAASLIYIKTDRGTLVVEAAPDAELTVVGESLRLVDPQTNKTLKITIGENPLPSGVYQLQIAPEGDGYAFSSSMIAIRRGQKQVVSVRVLPPESPLPIDTQADHAPLLTQPRQMALDSLESLQNDEQLDAGLREKLRQLREELQQQPQPESTAAEPFDLGSLPSLPAADVRRLMRLQADGPISPGAAVQQPQRLPGAATWTLESPRHDAPMQVAAISCDGRKIATAEGAAVRVWTSNGHFLQLLPCGDQVRQVRWSPDPDILAAVVRGTVAQYLIAWRLGQHDAAGTPFPTAHVILVLPVSAQAVAWSPSGRSLSIHNQNGDVEFYDVSRGAAYALPNLGLTASSFTDRPWSFSERYFAVTKLNRVEVWDLQRRQLLHTFSDATTAHWLDQGERLAVQRFSADSLRLIEVWDVMTLRRQEVLQGDSAEVMACSYGDVPRLAMLDSKGALQIRGVRQEPSQARTMQGNLAKRFAGSHLEWSRDGSSLLCWASFQAAVWTAQNDQFIELPLCNPSIGSLVSYGGDRVLTSAMQYSKTDAPQIEFVDRVFELESGRVIFARTRGEDRPAEALSPQGSFIITTGEGDSGQIGLTPVEAGQDPQQFTIPESVMSGGKIASIQCTDDELFLVAAIQAPSPIAFGRLPQTIALVAYRVGDAEPQVFPGSRLDLFSSFPFTLAGHRLLRPTHNGIEVTDLMTGTQERIQLTEDEHTRLFSMACRDAVLFATASSNAGLAWRMDLNTKEVQKFGPNASFQRITGAQLSPHARYAAFANRNRTSSGGLSWSVAALAAGESEPARIITDENRPIEHFWHIKQQVLGWVANDQFWTYDAPKQQSQSRPVYGWQGSLQATPWGWLSGAYMSLQACDPWGRKLGTLSGLGADAEDGKERAVWTFADGGWSGDNAEQELVATWLQDGVFHTAPLAQFSAKDLQRKEAAFNAPNP